MLYTINNPENSKTSLSMSNTNTLVQACELCGGEDQFLVSYITMDNKPSLQLCSACYAETISSRLYRLPKQA